MAAHRFPVLVWQDFGDQYTACAIEHPEEAVAAGSSKGDVLEQLKEYFAWLYKQQPWRSGPEYGDALLTHFKVPVRAEYRGKDDRLYPSEPVNLLVACVHGKFESGLYYGAVPLIGVNFSYHESGKLRETVQHYVQQALKGKTPEELIRMLPPKRTELAEVIVHVPRAAASPLQLPEIKTLEKTAEPISSKRYRRGLSRPWERDTEVNQLTAILTKEKTSVILVGNAGVGKTAVLLEAARKAQQTTPAKTAERDDDRFPASTPRIWLTSAARIIAGMQYLGQWQERCEAVLAELTEIDGVLCVERLLDLILSGARDPSAGIGAFLVPYLQRGELRLIGEATPEELDACRRLLPSLVDACKIQNIAPLTRPQTLSAFEQTAKIHERNSRIAIDASVIPLVFQLFHRFQPYQPMPGPAVNFLESLFDHAAKSKSKQITADTVINGFIRRTGLAEWLLRDDVPLRRIDVLAEFEKSIIGQNPGCQAAANVVLAFKAGLNDPDRPLGVLLFAGPTGVGKTELAKSLSRYLFGNSANGQDADRLIRLDMSEYAGPGAAERFLGPPEGEPADWIRRVRQQPFCVLLLDEIEKASPEIFDMLLGMFDEGRLTDRYGRLTTFKSAVVIMTSNLGASSTEPFGISKVAARTFESEVAAFFRPEFFNRIDSVVTFAPLSQASMRAIAQKELEEVARREGLTQREITFEWDAQVVEHLVAHGFDKRYGARPLQRTVESQIVTPLAKLIAAQQLNNRRVKARVVRGEVRVEKT